MELSLPELAVFNLIVQDTGMTQKQLAEKTGLSIATIKRRTIDLQEKGFIRRVNGKRSGKWEILRNP